MLAYNPQRNLLYQVLVPLNIKTSYSGGSSLFLNDILSPYQYESFQETLILKSSYLGQQGIAGEIILALNVNNK